MRNKDLLTSRNIDSIFGEKIKNNSMNIKGTISTQAGCPGKILRTIENSNGDNKHIYKTA